ncbi:MAG: FAD:protein FMN transferase [Kineosporiaceae bacterium]
MPIPFPRPGRAPRRRLVVTADPAAGPAARRVLAALHGEAARRVDLDDPHAEVYRLLAAGGEQLGVSAVLADLVRVALAVAHESAGLVDPTVGAAVVAGRVRAGRGRSGPGVVPVCGSPAAFRPRPAAGYDRVVVGPDRLCVPQGTILDLRATTDAVVAAAAAARAAGRTRSAVLVGVGGDVAQAGSPPPGGWLVPLPDGSRFALPAGLAASTVRPSAAPANRVVDPATGAAVVPAWHSLTVLHPDVVAAKRLALSAAVLGGRAVAFLRCEGVPFRLVGPGDAVTTSAGWPADDAGAADVAGSRRAGALAS